MFTVIDDVCIQHFYGNLKKNKLLKQLVLHFLLKLHMANTYNTM